ncbi:ABC transporter ATP-binding protein [Halobellus sp. EA9]|uniref:ABC transporter ATP-binding protein n=1 Tax=Halobellus sp. EA9 TaxID=3421647 RepID=UPI003EBB615F
MSEIDVNDVSKAYGSVQALDGLSLSVDRGSSVGVFGTNGAGKTTLFKLLVGLDRPDEGAIRVCGADPTSGLRVRERVRYLPEQTGFPPTLTGREILSFHARVRSVPTGRRDRHVERVLRTVGLREAADRRVGGYSNGMNRRLGLGTALIGGPAVLLLDEPTAGLDPEGIAAFHDVVSSLTAQTDITLVFSSHALSEIERLCDRAVIVADGHVAADGPVESLRRDAAEGVTLSLVLSDSDDVAPAAETVRAADANATVSRRGATLEIECPREAAYDLLTAVGERSDLDRFEVSEPGLEAAFYEAVGADRSPPDRTKHGAGGELP